MTPAGKGQPGDSQRVQAPRDLGGEPGDLPRVLTLREVLRELRISKDTWYRTARALGHPLVRPTLGLGLRFNREDVLRAINTAVPIQARTRHARQRTTPQRGKDYPV